MPTSVWRGRLAFGMVSIPVRLYKAARRERIRFHHVYRPSEIPEPQAPVEESEEQPPVVRSTNVAEFPRQAPATSAPAYQVARVRNMPVGELSEAPIKSPDVLKGFEIEKD